MDDEYNEGYQETLCNVEVSKENNVFVARIESAIGGIREYRSSNIEEIYDQIMLDLQEDFSSY